jgi:membrane fusion protein
MKTWPLQKVQLGRESLLLPVDPPARVACCTAWLLLAIFAAALVFVGFVELPEVVTASFVLESEEGTDPIQAPLAAELAAVRVREGQEVKDGDELFALRSDEIRSWQTRLRQSQEDLHALEERSIQLDVSHETQLSIKAAELAQSEQEIVFRQKFLDATRNFFKRAEKMAVAGALSQVELMRYELEVAEAERDHVLGEKSRQQTLLQRQELATLRVLQRTYERAESEKWKVQIATLERQLANCTNDVKSVRAPYDAVVLSLRQRNPGSVVASGTELCQLARAGAHPFARLTLPESGLPRLRSGLELRLRYEAYPYQRYGSFPAQLTWISPAGVLDLSGRVFQATCKLHVPQGSTVIPRVGMRGEARILVGRRTLFNKILEPLRMLRERMTVG